MNATLGDSFDQGKFELTRPNAVSGAIAADPVRQPADYEKRGSADARPRGGKHNRFSRTQGRHPKLDLFHEDGLACGVGR